MDTKFMDTSTILDEVAAKIDMTPEERADIFGQIIALATASKPPAWGYAGMLLALVEKNEVESVIVASMYIAEWRARPKEAFAAFWDWNIKRRAAR